MGVVWGVNVAICGSPMECLEYIKTLLRTQGHSTWTGRVGTEAHLLQIIQCPTSRRPESDGTGRRWRSNGAVQMGDCEFQAETS